MKMLYLCLEMHHWHHVIDQMSRMGQHFINRM